MIKLIIGHYVLSYRDFLTLCFPCYHLLIQCLLTQTFLFKVGHSWLPLLTKEGQVWCDEQRLPVCVNLPPGYLTMQDALRGVSGIEYVCGLDEVKSEYHRSYYS